MKLNHFGKLRKEGDKLIYIKDKDKRSFEDFRKSLGEGAIVDIFLEEIHQTGTLSQLAYAHVLLRELSNHTGHSTEDLKTILKEKAGLCLLRNVTGREYFLCKSLGDADSIELSAFIQAAIDLGIEINHPVA